MKRMFLAVLLLAAATARAELSGSWTGNADEHHAARVQLNMTTRHTHNVGESMDLSASAFWDTGRRCSKMVDEEPDGGWESEDEAIVTVDATGRVTAVGLGLAVVRPHWRGVTSSGSMIHVVE